MRRSAIQESPERDQDDDGDGTGGAGDGPSVANGASVAKQRVYLESKFEDKDYIKSRGGRWDSERGKWCVCVCVCLRGGGGGGGGGGVGESLILIFSPSHTFACLLPRSHTLCHSFVRACSLARERTERTRENRECMFSRPPMLFASTFLSFFFYFLFAIKLLSYDHILS